MKTFRLVAALAAAMLLSTAAHAADTCTIREYSAIAQAPTQPAQIGLEPAIDDQTSPDFTSSAQQFANPLNAATSAVCMMCSVQASYLVGANPTAAATNFPIPANQPWCFGVTPNSNQKISVHTNP